MEINAEIKRWGNSLAIIIPADIVNKENMREEQKIKLLLVKDNSMILRETFGSLKGKFKKTAQEMKDENRRDLYND